MLNDGVNITEKHKLSIRGLRLDCNWNPAGLPVLTSPRPGAGSQKKNTSVAFKTRSQEEDQSRILHRNSTRRVCQKDERPLHTKLEFDVQYCRTFKRRHIMSIIYTLNPKVLSVKVFKTPFVSYELNVFKPLFPASNHLVCNCHPTNRLPLFSSTKHFMTNNSKNWITAAGGFLL